MVLENSITFYLPYGGLLLSSLGVHGSKALNWIHSLVVLVKLVHVCSTEGPLTGLPKKTAASTCFRHIYDSSQWFIV